MYRLQHNDLAAAEPLAAVCFPSSSLPADERRGPIPAGATSRYVAVLSDSLVKCLGLSSDYGLEWRSRILRAGCLALIHRYAGFDRDAAESPTFNRLLKTIADGTATGNAAGDRLALAQSAPLPSDCDLGLCVVRRADVYAAVWTFRQGDFEGREVELIHGHFSRLLESAVAHPDLPISAHEILGAEESAELIDVWSARGRGSPPSRSIIERFEEIAAAHAGKVAVTDVSATVSYFKLNGSANRLAHRLLGMGVEAGDHVGIALPRSIDMVVAMIAVLKCGAAYVPLDTSYPTERLKFSREEAGAARIVTLEIHSALWRELGAEPLCVDGDASAIASESPENPSLRCAPSSTAYVMYTSGSTGEPKGVIVPHRGIVRLVNDTDYIDFSPREVFAQIANAAFDATTFEVWGALLNGASLVILETGTVLSPQKFARAIEEHGLSAMFLTSALFNVLVNHIPESLRRVRHVLVGGEAVDPNSARKFLAADGAGRLINGYGPTEGTTFAITHPIEEVPAEARLVPIGRPIANTSVYILDRHLRPVPVGVTGELYLGGAGLAHGYLKRPELTAQRFPLNPFAPAGDGRLYATGDLARYRRDGVIECLGRTDQQVKIRGFRVEPGEVEAVLRTHPSVSDCAVAVRSDAQGAKFLAAYMVAYTAPSAAKDGLLDEIRRFLETRLPSFLIPAAIMLIDRLPLSPNGKLDRRALPEPARPRETLAGQTTEIERSIQAIWTRVLGIAGVGLDENFFEAGGTSLRLAEIEVELKKHLGRDVSTMDLFRYPTVRSLAKHLGVAPLEESLRNVADSRKRVDKRMEALRAIKVARKI